MEKVCVKEKDGKTDFFCFEKGNIKLETLPALRGKMLFSDVNFENGSLKLKKTADGYNFSDLIELLPKNNRPIHLNWNARNFGFTGFTITLVPDAENGNEVVLTGARLSVEHRSSTGGNFVLKVKSGINARLGGKFVSVELDSFSDLNFEYARLRSARSSVEIAKIVLDDITAGGIIANLEAFGLDGKNSQKKFELEALLEDLFIPASNPLAENIREKTAVFEKLLGKSVQNEREFSMKTLEIKSSYNGTDFVNSLALDSNLVGLSLKSGMDLKNSRHSVSLEMKNRAKTMKITSDSAFSKPNPQPSMSETVDGMLKLGIISLEKYLLKKIGD